MCLLTTVPAHVRPGPPAPAEEWGLELAALLPKRAITSWPVRCRQAVSTSLYSQACAHHRA